MDKCDSRGAVSPDVQAMLDYTNELVERSRRLIRETDANLRSHADLHKRIAQGNDDCK